MLPTSPSYKLFAQATYAIAGGFGRLGPLICRWVASRGARKLVIWSGSGPRSDSAKQLLVDSTIQGIRVEHILCDVSPVQKVKEVLARCARGLSPIKSCVQALLVNRIC
jgi:NAD(P)-dependent dehydrogenase (short-subunit alcohol dehydrogenase family)